MDGRDDCKEENAGMEEEDKLEGKKRKRLEERKEERVPGRKENTGMKKR